tara:strand:+ start:1239 stop:1790 length:552 start_codon:yes stop_codon:yes gene_type:complete
MILFTQQTNEREPLMTTLLNLFLRFKKDFDYANSELKSRSQKMSRSQAEKEVAEIMEQKGLKYPCRLLDYVYIPIAKEVKRAIGADSFEIIGPSGIDSDSKMVWYIDKNEEPTVLKATFKIDPSAEHGKLRLVDYSVNTGKYPEGSYGFDCGGNFGITDIPDDTPINKITPILIENYNKEKAM